MEEVLNQILTEIRDLKEGQGRLENRIGSLEEGQTRLETKIDKLGIRIENEVSDKIRALFDDRSAQMDYFASIRDTLARIENRVEFLARQNVEHFTKLQEHDREIRLLRLEKSRVD